MKQVKAGAPEEADSKAFGKVDRDILRLAVPNMISNIIIPMLGMVDVAIAGRIGDDVNIAALAIGVTIFNFIYWNCAFLRMGTSGITAQEYGAGRKNECADMLLRAFWMACVMALLLLVLQKPIGRLALAVMQGSDGAQALAAEYFFARVWAVPASIMLFAIHGWFIGMQDAKTPMMVSILSVVTNALFSLLFVFRFGMGIAGIGYGTVAAQYCGLIVSIVLLTVKYKEYLRYFNVRASLRIEPVVRFLRINSDIFIRTLCVVAAYTFFTAASARMGDTILATNALLMQLFTLFSYMSDGFAYAAESLSGRFAGERNIVAFRLYSRRLIVWALYVALFFVAVYVFAWREILGLFSPSEEIINCAGKYIVWVIAVPLAGCVPFMLDGIMIGATKTRILRNTVFASLILYFGSYYILLPLLGNTALWIAFLLFITVRGILLYFGTGRMNAEKIILQSIKN